MSCGTGTTRISLLISIVLLLAPVPTRSVDLSIAIDQNTGAFKVQLDGVSWLASGDFGFYSAGWASTAANDSALSLISTQQGGGADLLGPYHYTSFIWLSPSRIPMVTTIREYHDFPGAVFEQSFPQGLSATTYVVFPICNKMCCLGCYVD